jgi:hypothetical protein
LCLQQERYVDDTRSEHGVPALYSRRLSASIDTASYDRSPKVVEMDTGRPRSRASSLRTSSPALDDEWWAAQSASSPLHPPPPRIAVRCAGFPADLDYWEKPRPATAQCTPRCTAPLYWPTTPTKSPCVGAAHNKGYMSSTQSSEAKTNRSKSAPKQRPDESAGGGARKRVPLSEVVLTESRASLSGVNMQRSCNRAVQQEAFDFRKAVVSRFERSAADGRDRDVFLQRRW